MRAPLTILVYCFPVFIVLFGVLMGAYALSQATGDGQGAAILWQIAMACLVLFAVNTILLVGVLGVIALERNTTENEDERTKE